MEADLSNPLTWPVVSASPAGSAGSEPTSPTQAKEHFAVTPFDRKPDPACSLCGKSVDRTECINAGAGQHTLYHKPCWNAKKAFERCTTASERSKLAEAVDPTKLKESIAAHAVPGRRSEAETLSMKAFAHHIVSFTKVTRIADCVLLSERRFIQWYVVWEGYDRESATAKWRQDSVDPNIKSEMQGGEHCVWVQDATRMRGESGIERVRDANEAKERAPKRMRQSGGITDGVFRGVGTFGGTVFKDGATSKSSPKDSLSSYPCQELTPRADHAKVDGSGLEGSPPEPASVGKADAAADAQAQPQAQLTRASFDMARGDLVYQLDCKLHEYRNRKHVVASLQKKVAALGADSETVKALDLPSELEKSVSLTSALRCLRDDLRTGTVESFLEMKAACEAKLKEVAVHMSGLSGILQDLQAKEKERRRTESHKRARA